MSADSKNRELLGTTRLLIPTPSQGLVRCESDDTSALLRMYYSNYQRLKKEQSTLTNQLAIIERERQELRERLDAMRVPLCTCSESRKRKERDIAGPPERSTEISYVRSGIAKRSMAHRGHCCSTSRSSIARSTTRRSMRPWCYRSIRRIRKDSSHTRSIMAASSDHSPSCIHKQTHKMTQKASINPFLDG
jgi:hypothetical protein